MNKTIKPLYIILFTVICLFLAGCRDDKALIKQIQSSYDDNNPSGKRAFCVLVGPATQYPYSTQSILWDEINQQDHSDRYKFYSNETLNSRLDLFSRLGLFSQELVTSAEQATKGEAIYSYSLTDEGKKYISIWKTSSGFCFGRRVIDKIISDRQDKDNWGNTVTTIRFNYSVEGLPDWAKSTDIEDEFGFDSFGLHVNDGQPSTGSLFFKDSSSGLKISGGPSGMWLFR